MAEATVEQLDKLSPYINGGRPDSRGEVEMYCPLHNDSRRSASVNVKMGVWYCHAGCGGGSLRHLIDAEDTWVSAEGRVSSSLAAPRRSLRLLRQPSARQIHRWHRRLMNSEEAQTIMEERRGLNGWALHKARIGYDGHHFKIPVFSPEGKLWNVRTWDPDPKDERRKIWSVRGMGRARLFPAALLETAILPHDTVLICEGEWDALLAIQHGFRAISRTDGAGKPWHEEWNVAFTGLRVYMCHDLDKAGLDSDQITAAALEGVADEVWRCSLPFEYHEKHGADLTDFVLEQADPVEGIGSLLQGAVQWM